MVNLRVGALLVQEVVVSLWTDPTNPPFGGVPTALMFLLGILDFLFVSHAYHSILTRGASVQLVFGFEVKLAWEVGRTSLRWHCMCFE